MDATTLVQKPVQSSVPKSAIHGKNMLAMYRGQIQETAPSLFTAGDEGYPAEGLPQTGRPPKEAAFQRRFGLALLASTALHVLLVLLVPSLPYSTVAPPIADPDMLTVSLTSLAALPIQPMVGTDRPKEAGQATVPTVPEDLQPPAVQAQPQPDQVPIQQQAPEAALTIQAEPATPIVATTQTELAPVILDSQEAMFAPGTQVPEAPLPDAAQIGEEFKLSFMSLLAYPEPARRRGVQGTVGLRILMDKDGRILDALISQTSGSSVLDRAAARAALATPGPLAGPGRRLELSIRISFEAGRVLVRP